jgi:hypothetical protein
VGALILIFFGHEVAARVMLAAGVNYKEILGCTGSRLDIQ